MTPVLKGPICLEVLVCFDGAVLSAHSLRSGETLRARSLGIALDKSVDTIVEKSMIDDSTIADDFPVAGIDAAGPFVEWPESAPGDVTVGAATRTLDELARGGLALPSDDRRRRYTLPDDARAVIELGALTLLVHAGEVARRIPASRSVEWQSHKWTVMVAGGVALAMAMAFSAPPDAAMASGDFTRLTNEQIHARFFPSVEVAVEPLGQAKKAPPGSSPARGKVGIMGKPEHVGQHGHVAVRGNAPVAHVAGGTDVRAVARTTGVLAILGDIRGGALGAVLDPSQNALGDAAVAFEGNLDGVQAGPGWGNNGGGIIGTGPGGGCTGANCVGTVSVGDLGRICPGGICSGGPNGGRMPPSVLHRNTTHKPDEVEILKGEVRVPSTMDKETIRRVIHAHMNEIRFCYEKELPAQPDLEGKLVMSFVVLRDGRVASAQAVSSTMHNTSIGGCVSQTLGRLSFPMPASSPIASVQYPFVFHHAGAPAAE